MKRIYYLSLLALGISNFLSCKKAELENFDSPSQLYFYDPESFSRKLRDSVLLSFARFPLGTQETDITIPLAYIGKVSDSDRPYRVVVDKEKTTAIEGIHYKLSPDAFKVHAGKSDAALPIKILSATDLDTKTVQVVLKLEKNENFDINFSIINTDLNPIDVSTYRVLISNMLLKPSWWSATVDHYLGEFSRKKIELIDEVTSKNLEYLEESVTTYQWDALKVIARETQIHINYKRSIGEELQDENKKPIDMGPYVN